MLSYAGGLFSLLFAFIFFFIGSYSEYGYELAIAERMKTGDQEADEESSEKKYNFWTFLKYALFDWIKTFHIPISWKRMEEIDAKREEANEQMDARRFLKRIQNLEKLNELLFEEYQIALAQLSEPMTLERLKKMRLISEFQEKICGENSEISLSSSKVADESSLANNNNNDREISEEEIEVENEIKQFFKKALSHQNESLNKKILQKVSEKIKQHFKHSS